MISRPLARLAAVLALSALAALARAEEVTLEVYTALEPEELEKYAKRFNQAHPQVRIQWTRESTGVITGRLLAERERPRADVVWGLAATSLLLMKDAGLLEPYLPRGAQRLDPRFRDRANPPHWVGMDAWVGALCVNLVEVEARKLPVPESWQDLTAAVYRGQLAMPDPATSGTGFLAVSGWLQMLGEEQGWAYMDALHANVAHYTHSGSRPCQQAARGELAIGIAPAFRGARLKAAGAPVDVVVPREGVGWEMEAAAIVRGTPRLDAARTLLDWAVSEQALQMYNEGYAIIGLSALARPVEHFPARVPQAMIENDFEWAARNRARILDEWQRRYAAKLEPKSR